ncbi:hypothetical protein ACFVVX_28800 [Kitasatospora sp. NPDC058170]|uniref:hypothetical protein n=1 Tax=Kitasatospora sp. NPDC058170 TaxID=3346364 RepID=UPI0036DCA7C7
MSADRARPHTAPPAEPSTAPSAGLSASPTPTASTPSTPSTPSARPRLRPGVAATPLQAGLHLRGRDGIVTLEGSRALPALWQLLRDRLGETPGADPGTDPGADPGLGPNADPRVEAALTALTARLREHDLLVEHPDGVELPPWPGSVATSPAEAARALAAARPVITAALPGHPLALALARALTLAGTTPEITVDEGLPTDRVLALAATSPVAVVVDADDGFVTAPADPARALADAEALTTRLRRTDEPTDPPADAPADAPAVPGTPPALLALLAGAAAQRLLCAVTGLPDPSDPDQDPRLLTGRPAVLLAQARPPRADYHPWAAGPPAPGHPLDAPAPVDLAEALRRADALGDPRLGALDAPMAGSLPQLPAALVSCRIPAGTLVSGAVRTDLARLEAVCRSAELHLVAAPSAGAGAAAGVGAQGAVVGATAEHALGRALRRAALALPAETGPALSEDGRHDHPQARHWWTTLRRLRPEAAMTVRRLGSEEVFLATVRTSAGPPARAVEATAADAAALAALAALTRATAADLALGAAHHTALSGACAPLAAAGIRPAEWADEGWTDHWLTVLADREPDLRAALDRLTGLRTALWRPTGAPDHPVAAGLRACGFTVLIPAASGGHR